MRIPIQIQNKIEGYEKNKKNEKMKKKLKKNLIFFLKI